MIKLIEFIPARDDRNSDPNIDYGISSMQIRFILKGDRGAVQFVIHTNWMLPHVAKEHCGKASKGYHGTHWFEAIFLPMGIDIGYHSPSPTYPDQSITTNHCPYLDGPCYYDGETSSAMALFEKFLAEGDDVVWTALAAYYGKCFG